jgi:ATP-dependent exoDNAse (exonuclease V) beta subunit
MRFVSAGGVLNYQAPFPGAAADMTALARAFELLGRLHRKRRAAAPSEVITQLFERTRVLPAFRAHPGGEQLVANLWKVLEVARAYEASGPATLRAVVRFLEEEARAGREEGDSPVGEQAGEHVEILTVHKAKGLEYPIVIVADLLKHRDRPADCIIDHARGEGWLEIGSFKPDTWAEREQWDKDQRDAEERRLLYVALTRARDHLVIPCLPGEPYKGWLDQAVKGFLPVQAEKRDAAVPFGTITSSMLSDGTPGEAKVTWLDTRTLDVGIPDRPRGTAADTLEGAEANASAAAKDEQAWLTASSSRRRTARRSETPTRAVTEAAVGAAATQPDQPKSDRRKAAAFGSLVHDLLANAVLSSPLEERAAGVKADSLIVAATVLAQRHGLGTEEAAQAADLAAKALASPELQSLADADRILREVPVSTRVNGELVRGRIDVAYRREGEWSILDFKTASFDTVEEARQAHGAQLDAYARALARLVGQQVKPAILLLRSGRLVPVPGRANEGGMSNA